MALNRSPRALLLTIGAVAQTPLWLTRRWCPDKMTSGNFMAQQVQRGRAWSHCTEGRSGGGTLAFGFLWDIPSSIRPPGIPREQRDFSTKIVLSFLFFFFFTLKEERALTWPAGWPLNVFAGTGVCVCVRARRLRALLPLTVAGEPSPYA